MDLPKNIHRDSLKKSQLTLSQLMLKREMSSLMLMMMKRWEPVHHRTVGQQHWVLRNSSSGLSIYSSPLISSERCGGGEQEINGQHGTYRGSLLGFNFQPNLQITEQVWQNLYISFWLGKMSTAKFFIYGETEHTIRTASSEQRGVCCYFGDGQFGSKSGRVW
jgi:hypothetical protein